MYTLSLVLFFLLVSVIFFIIMGKTQGDTAGFFGFLAGASCLIAIIFVIILIGRTMANSADQREDILEYEKLTRTVVVLDKKATTLTAQFATYLAQTYPEYEKGIFQEISPDKVSLYMVKYPELQASKTIILLIEQISGLQNDVYNTRLKILELSKNMKFRKVNPWYLHLLMPEFEEPQLSTTLNPNDPR